MSPCSSLSITSLSSQSRPESMPPTLKLARYITFLFIYPLTPSVNKYEDERLTSCPASPEINPQASGVACILCNSPCNLPASSGLEDTLGEKRCNIVYILAFCHQSRERGTHLCYSSQIWLRENWEWSHSLFHLYSISCCR